MMLDDFELPRDIGFHYFEIGNPQRLLVTIEVWLDEASFADSDHVERAWNYDFLRSTVIDLVHGRRFNLQETLVREIYGIVAARKGVVALKVSTRDRKSVVSGKSVEVRVDLGGRRIIKKQKKI